MRVLAAFAAAATGWGCYGGSQAGSGDASSPPQDAVAEERVDATADANAGGEAGEDVDAGPTYAVCPDAMDASFESIYVRMLAAGVTTCGSAGLGCHSTFSAKQNGNLLDFSLDASAVYGELLGDGGGFPATNIAGDAGGVLRVVPGDPDASMLYIKLTLTTGGSPYGAGMPLYTPGSVCPAAVDAVRQWIAGGAAR